MRGRRTIRYLMAVIVFIAVAIWAGLAAERTRSNRARFHTHLHANGIPHDPDGGFSMTPHWIPFWPEYLRTLLGLPWDWRYQCLPGNGPRAIVCDRDYPQMYVRDDRRKHPPPDYPTLLELFGGKMPR